MINRSELRIAFIEQCQWQDAQITALVPDASFRKYFRLEKQGKSVMLMDAPAPYEDASAFIKVTLHLIALGIKAPGIIFADEENGFVLLQDLGNDTFTNLIERGADQEPLYQHAINTLVTLHQHPMNCKVDVDTYDLNRILPECELFTDWYLPSTNGSQLDIKQKNSFIKTIESLYNSLPELPNTLVLRDYHVDNLMMVENQNAVLDYQDALIGSPAYDVVSLLQDARRDINEKLQKDMLKRYLSVMPLVDEADFQMHYDFWGMQRHLKVAGIFVRLWRRDNKNVYLKHLPRVMALLDKCLNKPSMQPLSIWFDQNNVPRLHRKFK